MTDRRNQKLLWLLSAAFCGAFVFGCSRADYRNQADIDAARLVVNASDGTRAPWANFSIDVPPESRMFDGNNPDHPPMPPDDPNAHLLMHCVDCKEGYPCWHAHGDTTMIQNPHWQAYLPWTAEGEVIVDLETAIQLGLYHSRDFQQNLEELYLSALDVSAERFRFDVQYFGGNDTFITTDGRVAGGGRSSSALSTGTDFGFNKAFAAGGQFLVGFANNFVWQFAGNDTVSTNSLLNFSLVQPLLRGGGKARVMEQLTLSERDLLSNIRAMERFRRGFYMEIATGDDGGAGGPNRRGGLFGGSGLGGFTGIGGGFGRVGGGGGGGGFAGGAGAAGAGGYLGILQTQRELRNAEANVASLQDGVELLEAFRQANRIDRFQVDLLRQALYNAQSQLLTAKARYQESLDSFKLRLGLPPELPIRVEGDFLDQFELLSPELIELQTAGTDVLSRMWSGQNPDDPDQQPGDNVPPAIDNLATFDQLLANIALLESTKNLLELYRFRPNAQPQDTVTVAQYQVVLDNLIESHRRLLQVLDPLQNYGPVMGDARDLQERSLASLTTVRQSVNDLEEIAPRRIEILEQLSASEPVQSGEVDASAFSVEVLQQRQDRLSRAFALINDRLTQPLEAWEFRRERIEDLQEPATSATQRLLQMTTPLGPVVQQLEQLQVAVREADLQGRDQANQDFFAALENLVPMLGNLQLEMRTANASVEGFLTQSESILDQALQAVRRLADDASEMGLIQARARLEAAYLAPQSLTEERAFAIAQEYRRDWMNQRAGLVDRWRSIEFIADDLESDLDITFGGSLGTTADNPFGFRDSNGSLTAGLAFDAPLQRLAERNVYRESLIQYQQAKRGYVAYVDGVRASLRSILRIQELNVLNFELRRRSVHVAIDQVEYSRLKLYEPPRPGETSTFGETTARDLASALQDLLSVQNDFLSVWVNYELQRMNMDLALGTMELDDRGMWLDPGGELGNVPLSCDFDEVPEFIDPYFEQIPEGELQQLFGNPETIGPPSVPPAPFETDDTFNGEAVRTPNPFDLRPQGNSGDQSSPAGEPLRLQLPGLTAETGEADDPAIKPANVDVEVTKPENDTTKDKQDELEAKQVVHRETTSGNESKDSPKEEKKPQEKPAKKKFDPLFDGR